MILSSLASGALSCVPVRSGGAALIEAAKAIGIPGFHPHELRYTAASLAIASGADVKVVQQMLGHKSATMTSISTATCSAIGSTLWLMPWTRRVPPRWLMCTRCVPRGRWSN